MVNLYQNKAVSVNFVVAMAIIQILRNNGKPRWQTVVPRKKNEKKQTKSKRRGKVRHGHVRSTALVYHVKKMSVLENLNFIENSR